MMFRRMPSDTGFAFVVVQHGSPDFESQVVLARGTDIPAEVVEHETRLAPDHIYVMPPKTELIVSGGRLLLTERSEGLPLPVDHFLGSLAHDAGDQAIAVILSGTGSDGSRGARDVHDVGGFVIVQSPASARFDGMPRSAVETGVADAVVAPDLIPSILQSRAHDSDEPPTPRKEIQQRDHFLGMLSHELRNPLAAVHNALTLLRRRVPNMAAIQRPLAMIERQAAHMHRLLDDLLDVSRVTQGKIKLRLEPLDLRVIAQDAMDVVRAPGEQRKHVVALHVGAEPLWIRADGARLLQVCQNLLTNAIKYTPKVGTSTCSSSRVTTRPSSCACETTAPASTNVRSGTSSTCSCRSMPPSTAAKAGWGSV